MKLQKQEIPFTMVANEVLCRRDVSLKAKGLYAYLFSKPDGWDFSSVRIADECREDKKTVQSGLQELERVALLVRRKLPTGRVEYFLKFAAEPEQDGATLFAAVPAGDRAGDPVLSDVNPIIDMFKPVNPSHDMLFSNLTQRRAVERMLRRHGRPFVENALRAAAECFGKPFAPVITTPLQLEARMGSLGSFVKRARSAPAGVVSL